MERVVKNPPVSAGDTRDMGSIPVLGRSPGEGNGNPLKYSCIENSMDRGVWWSTVHRVAESDMTEHTHARMHPGLKLHLGKVLLAGYRGGTEYAGLEQGDKGGRSSLQLG